jgi:hypothetical protein
MGDVRLMRALESLLILGLISVLVSGVAEGIWSTGLQRRLPQEQAWATALQVGGIVAVVSLGAILGGLIVAAHRYLSWRARTMGMPTPAEPATPPLAPPGQD